MVALLTFLIGTYCTPYDVIMMFNTDILLFRKEGIDSWWHVYVCLYSARIGR